MASIILGVKQVPESDDIFRGMRWGAILLVALAIGVAGYRMVRVDPASSVPAPSASVPADEPTAAPASTPPAAAAGSNTVPMPPVKTHAKRKPSHRSSAQHAVKADPGSKGRESSSAIGSQDDSSPAAAEENPAEQQAEAHIAQSKPSADPDAPPLPAEAAQPAASASAENAAASDSRGKRLLKAVGRFLHIGPKKPEMQAVRQPD